MRRRSMHENREIPSTLAAEGAAGRSEKASGRASGAYVRGKSDTRKTIASRLRAKLRELKAILLRWRHTPVLEQAWLQRVVRGYFNYHAIPGNRYTLDVFRTQVIRHWLRALRRRSQKHRLNWARFAKLVIRWIPRARILHPYPSERFYAIHPR